MQRKKTKPLEQAEAPATKGERKPSVTRLAATEPLGTSECRKRAPSKNVRCNEKMKLRYGEFEAEVSKDLLDVNKLGDQPVIIELVKNHAEICSKCPQHVDCKQFPWCSQIQVKEWQVPLYPNGVAPDEHGKPKTVWRKGDICTCHSNARVVIADGKPREVFAEDVQGYEVLPDGNGGVRLEVRVPFMESTSTLDIGDSDLYPAGVATNFLQEKNYELYAKPIKKQADSIRNERRFYELVKKLFEKHVVVVKTGFVFKSGVYVSWAVVLEPIIFEDGSYDLHMFTTKCNLVWQHRRPVPPEATAPAEASTVNNLKALSSFLEHAKTAKATTPIAASPPLQLQQNQ